MFAVSRAQGRSPTDSVILAIAVAGFVLAALQLSLGTSTVVVFALLGTTLISLVPVRVYRLSHIVGALFLLVCFYFGFLALLLPSLVMRPADEGLFVPEFSAQVILTFAIAAAAGALIPRFFMSRMPALVQPIASPLLMRRVAMLMFALGLAGWMLTRLEATRSIGMFLDGFITLALVLEIAATLVTSDNRRSLSMFGILILATVIITSLMNNSKVGLFITAATWLVTNLAYGRRVSWRTIVAMAVLSVAMTYFFFAVNIVRAVRDQVGPLELLMMTIGTALQLAAGDPQALAELDKLSSNVSTVNLMKYSLIYFDGLPVLTERFVLLPFADAMLRAIPPDGPFAGVGFITDQFTNLLPSVFNPDKQSTYVGNVMVMLLGLGDDGFAGHPTMGLAPELFFAGGYALVVVGTLVSYGVTSAALTATCGSVARNVFAIYIIARYGHFLVCGVSTSFVYFITRQLPFDVLVFMLAVRFLTRAPAGAVGSTEIEAKLHAS